MAQKRKATEALEQQSKKVQISGPTADFASVNDVHVSDNDSTFSSYSQDDQSDNDRQLPTPVTPYSPSSVRYPSDLKTHLCPFENCGKAFNRPARLAEHIRSHKNERIFKCNHENCDKTFLRASHLNHHVKSAHTSIRDYVCDREGCGKSFVTGSRLRRHLAAHDGRDKYRCTEYPPCSETFRKHSTLQKHVMMVHLNKKPFPCPHVDPTTGKQCTHAFDTAGHLRAHESRIHGGARFTCTECSKNVKDDAQKTATASSSKTQVTFPTYALLQAHMKSVHPPVCPDCQLACSSGRELRRHLEIAHGNVPLEERRIYPCDYPGCGRSFTKKGNLNVHVRTVHEGEKRFVCGETDLSTSKRVEGWTGEDGCGKRYGSKLALEEHIRTAHLGLKNAKAFRREQLGLRPRQKPKREELSALAMLTGEGYAEESGRPIPCLIESCTYRFHRDYDLWVHMSAKHGLEENDIQILFMQRTMQGGDQSFDLDFTTASGFCFDGTSGVGHGETLDGFDGLACGNEMELQNMYGGQHTFEEAFDNTTISYNDNVEVNDGADLIDPLLTSSLDFRNTDNERDQSIM
ncbi:hypothetical protein VTO42DRAFT_387 [Malbranchea cinnamomea]